MAKNNNQVDMSRFKNRCFVGLNKVTFYTEGGEVLTGDNWLELTDEQSRRSMMLAFFAPRDLDGEPMDPAAVLLEDGDEDADMDLLQQMKSIAMFDLCRSEKANPNTVHIALVADVIFHWDGQDNYIQPTSDDTWVTDLQAVLKGYPRTTEKHIYTDWEFPPKTELGEANTHPLEKMPLNQSMWINQPSFQEQYGGLFLITGVVLAVLAYVGLGYQSGKIDEINKQTQALNAQSRLYPNYSQLSQKVTTLENYNRYRGLFSFTFKDISLAAVDIDMSLESYTLQNPNPREAPEVLVTRLDVPSEEYPGFDQQEPLAKNLLKSSLTIQKIRKPAVPPGAENFTLEGLIPLAPLARLHHESRQQQAGGRRSNNESAQ